MKKEFHYKESFYVEGAGLYNLILTNEYQLVLEKPFPGFDAFGYEYPTTMYQAASNPCSGMKVYHQAVKLFLNYIHSHALNYFWYSTDNEEVRRKLYRFLAELFERHGYLCTYSTEDIFYFYKKAV